MSTGLYCVDHIQFHNSWFFWTLLVSFLFSISEVIAYFTRSVCELCQSFSGCSVISRIIFFLKLLLVCLIGVKGKLSAALWYFWFVSSLCSVVPVITLMLQLNFLEVCWQWLLWGHNMNTSMMSITTLGWAGHVCLSGSFLCSNMFLKWISCFMVCGIVKACVIECQHVQCGVVKKWCIPRAALNVLKYFAVHVCEVLNGNSFL